MGGYAIVELGQSYRRREATPEDMEGIIESGSQRWCRHWSRSGMPVEGRVLHCRVGFVESRKAS
ncbi:hypothetical protein CDL15_Pgr009670 [Punica granatum]|uniref:Uncharacterized protein n=1 Tax=Punica granatum TaxID=22663 RepID=A0A218WTB4_PUNGR|nr:hypothetical protein CDL15_Pgr009670 [Punica granatum]